MNPYERIENLENLLDAATDRIKDLERQRDRARELQHSAESQAEGFLARAIRAEAALESATGGEGTWNGPAK